MAEGDNRRVAITAVGIVLSAPASYVVQRALAAWGILDSISDALGRWLKVHVSAAAAGWTIAVTIVLVLYALLLWRVWRTREIHHVDLAPEPIRLGDYAEAEVVRPAPKLPPGPPHPDVLLVDVVKRIMLVNGPYPDDANDKREYIRAINLEIADKAWRHRLTVWARYMDQPLKLLRGRSLEHARWDVSKGTVALPSDWRPMIQTDVQFVRAEIDEIWPEQEPREPWP